MDVPGLLLKYKGRRIDLIADLEIKYKTAFVVRDMTEMFELAQTSSVSSPTMGRSLHEELLELSLAKSTYPTKAIRLKDLKDSHNVN